MEAVSSFRNVMILSTIEMMDEVQENSFTDYIAP
jgi:hypothetical protein